MKTKTAETILEIIELIIGICAIIAFILGLDFKGLY